MATIALPAFTREEKLCDICSQLWHGRTLDRDQEVLVMDCTEDLEVLLSAVLLLAIAKGVKL